MWTAQCVAHPQDRWTRLSGPPINPPLTVRTHRSTQRPTPHHHRSPLLLPFPFRSHSQAVAIRRRGGREGRGRGDPRMASRTVSKDIITLRGSAAIVSEFFGTRALALRPFLSRLVSRRPVTRRTGTVQCSSRERTAASVPIHRGLDRILYNRAVYPEESFTKVKKYGLTMLLTQDEGVKTFIANLTSQLSGNFPPSEICPPLIAQECAQWLEAGKLQRIVLVIMSKATSEVLERWNFNIVTDAEVPARTVSWLDCSLFFVRAIKEKSDKEIMREIQAIMRQIASCITYLPCLDEPCVFDVLAYTDTDVDAPGTWVESDAKLIDNPQMVKLHSFDTKIHKVDTLVSYKKDEWDDEE
ncbi:hypothetical protein HU200_027696 [Digitaria exilis]|uniref:HORMA domain-containing protein n=1 Tax=Digitaria exilis TaxID=1010633 RepID=A0A835EWK3_9POAL|nr:hypothetical protein HU200_027696 [Digitaria exilis]